jgi:hypothetical protein
VEVTATETASINATGQESHKWFNAMRSKENPVTWHLIIRKGMSFYDGLKINDKCTFSEGLL